MARCHCCWTLGHPLGQGLGVLGTSLWVAAAEGPPGIEEGNHPGLSLPVGSWATDSIVFLFGGKRRAVCNMGHLTVSPPPGPDLEDGDVSGSDRQGQQSGGFPFCPRQDLILYPGRPPPWVREAGSEQGCLALLSMWVGGFPSSGRPGPCPVSPGDRYYLQ